MKEKIFFKIESFKLEVELNDSLTAKGIADSLPIYSKINRWGDEIYFSIGLDFPPENETTDVNISDVAYWPEGKSLCIFFGPTPISTSDKPIPASGVNIIGKIVSDVKYLKGFKQDTNITVDKS